MNIKYCLFIVLTSIIYLSAEDVHFIIQKYPILLGTKTDPVIHDYNIEITPKTPIDSESLPKGFITQNTIAIRPHLLKTLTEKQMPFFLTLDHAIRSKITDNIVYDRQASNKINITTDISNPTPFNQVYRELYNDIRTFSKALNQPSQSLFSRFQQLIRWKSKDPVETKPILPDLVLQPSLFQQHKGKITAAGTTALTGAAAYFYLKSKQ